MSSPGTPGASPTNADGPDGLDRFFAWLRRLGVTRRTEDKWVGGVASGIADALRVDPVLVRAAFVLLGLVFGVGVTAYLLAWLLLPDRTGGIAAERAVRHGHGASVALLVVTAVSLFSGFPWWSDDRHVGFGFPWGLLLVGGMIWWFASRRGRPPFHGGPARWTPPAATQPPGSPVNPTGDQATPTAYRPGATTTAAAPAAAPAPVPTPRRRAGGPLMTVLAAGLVLVTYGATVAVTDRFGWAGDHHAIALYAALGALGALVVGLGLAGWRAGFVGFVATVAAVVALVSLLVPGRSFGGRFGDTTWRPLSLAGPTSYRLAAGEAVLDLRGLPAEGLSGEQVRVSVGLGDLTIQVPDDLTVEVRGQVGLGDFDVSGDPQEQSGAGVDRNVTIGSGPTEVVVTADVGLGELHVTKEQTS